MSNNIATKLQAILSAKGDIKDAIEGKGVTVGSASLDQYASKIEQISGGTTEAPENDVNFYDYDGFRVASYTIAEAKALTALPTPPTHEGLTFQEWNWTLSDIQGYNRRYIDIGANYLPTDGKTHIKIQTDSDGLASVSIFTKKNNTVLIEWGDGTDETLTSTSTAGSTVTKTHTYSNAGQYDVKISLQSGEYGFYPSMNTGYNSRNIIELNTGNDCIGASIVSAKFRFSLAKNSKEDFYLQYLSAPQITIPRECEATFESVRSLNSLVKICFPASVPNIEGGVCVSTISRTLVVPEFSATDAVQAASLLTSGQSYTTRLSIPSTLKFAAVPTSSQGFTGFACLREIDIAQGWIPNVSVSFANSTSFTVDALVDFFNKLGTTINAITLTFGSTNLDKLTAEEKAIATNKGYTLA